MPKKIKQITYSEVQDRLRSLQFDVAPVPNVANQVQVSKYGCAAILGPGGDDGVYQFVHRPGVLFGKEITHLVNHGYQQHFHTSRGDFAATADHLRNLHRFTEELKEAAGEPSLYNQALGTTSDDHLYDRLKGRDLPLAERPTPAWKLSAGH
jgi:hypothetical protein